MSGQRIIDGLTDAVRMAQAPIYTPDIEMIRDKAKPAVWFGEARDRLLRTAFGLEKTLGTRQTAHMLRAMADALESGRTPDF